LEEGIAENNTSKGLTALGNILRIREAYYLSLDNII